MLDMRRLLTFLLLTAALLLIPVAAWAATEDQVQQINDIEVGLIALFPAVIGISSLLLSPKASQKVKAVLPAVVSLIVAVIYFTVDTFPGFGADLLVEVGALVALSMRLYEPVSGLVRIITDLFGRERGLNEITGTGLVGRSGATEENV